MLFGRVMVLQANIELDFDILTCFRIDGLFRKG
jgi:hypothetical protein